MRRNNNRIIITIMRSECERVSESEIGIDVGLARFRNEQKQNESKRRNNDLGLCCVLFSSFRSVIVIIFKSNSHHFEHGCRMVPMRIYIKLIILAAIQRNSAHDNVRALAVCGQRQRFFFISFNSLTTYYTIILLYKILCKKQMRQFTMDRKCDRVAYSFWSAINTIRANFMSHLDFSVSSRFNRLEEQIKQIQINKANHANNIQH